MESLQEIIGAFTTWELLLFYFAAFLTAILNTVAGFAGGMALLAIFSFFMHPQIYIPMVALVMFVTNVVRLWILWREIQWPLVRSFLIGLLPGVLLGGYGFAVLPARVLEVLLGGFLLLYVVISVVQRQLLFRVRLGQFLPVGFFAGVVSTVIGAAGPFVAPFVLGFGLSGPVFVATTITLQTLTHFIKLFTYAYVGVLPAGAALFALLLSVALIPAIFVGRWAGMRVKPRAFRTLILVLLAIVGLRFLFF